MNTAAKSIDASDQAADFAPDVRIAAARISGSALVVTLMDGRTISAPLAWFPRLAQATPRQRRAFRISAAGYGLHWPDLDEDIGVDGLLRGARAPSTPAAPRPRAAGAAEDAGSTYRAGPGRRATRKR